MCYKKCYNCKFWATEDTGYSNWTVLETMVHCMHNHFEPVDESYSWQYENGESENDFFKRAETCSNYKEGKGIVLDVDGSNTIEDWVEDKELYTLAKKYEGWLFN